MLYFHGQFHLLCVSSHSPISLLSGALVVHTSSLSRLYNTCKDVIPSKNSTCNFRPFHRMRVKIFAEVGKLCSFKSSPHLGMHFFSRNQLHCWVFGLDDDAAPHLQHLRLVSTKFITIKDDICFPTLVHRPPNCSFHAPAIFHSQSEMNFSVHHKWK